MQIKMQEAQQMRLVAERSCEDLSRELLGCKDKIQTLQNQLDVLRTEYQTLQVAIYLLYSMQFIIAHNFSYNFIETSLF